MACMIISDITGNAVDLFVPACKASRFTVPLHIRQLRNEHARLHRELRRGCEALRQDFRTIRNRYKLAVK